MIHVNSLRARMTMAVTIAFAVWTLLVCIGLLGYTGHTASRQADHVLKAMINTLYHDNGDREQYGSDEHTPSDSQRINATVLKDFITEHRDDLSTNHVSALLINANGQIVQRTRGHVPPWPSTIDDDWRIRTVSSDTSTLVLGYNWGETEHDLRELSVTLLAFSFCVVIAAAFATWVLVGRTLSPIGRLAQQATVASTDTLHLQLDTPSQDVEMVGLVGTLNNLLERLSDTVTAKGRFYAAASHELRTPLQALYGHLQVSLSRQRSADEYRATLEEAQTQTRRLVELVRDLLFLNQLDTAKTPPACEMVCLAEVCARALRQCQTLIQQHGLQVHTAYDVDGEVRAPSAHAEMLIRNLIENAVKYASLEGDVRIYLHEDQGAITVTIINSCTPIANWCTETLFEPFYRIDSSRNAKTGGNGLGLAICKAITIANNWFIDLHHDGAEVTATLRLPQPHLDANDDYKSIVPFHAGTE